MGRLTFRETRVRRHCPAKLMYRLASDPSGLDQGQLHRVMAPEPAPALNELIRQGQSDRSSSISNKSPGATPSTRARS